MEEFVISVKKVYYKKSNYFFEIRYSGQPSNHPLEISTLGWDTLTLPEKDTPVYNQLSFLIKQALETCFLSNIDTERRTRKYKIVFDKERSFGGVYDAPSIKEHRDKERIKSDLGYKRYVPVEDSEIDLFEDVLSEIKL